MRCHTVQYKIQLHWSLVHNKKYVHLYCPLNSLQSRGIFSVSVKYIWENVTLACKDKNHSTKQLFLPQYGLFFSVPVSSYRLQSCPLSGQSSFGPPSQWSIWGGERGWKQKWFSLVTVLLSSLLPTFCLGRHILSWAPRWVCGSTSTRMHFQTSRGSS